MKVIINADDLGINPEVNACIEQFINTGAISSSSILANGKAFDLVPDIVRRHPNVSFGVHLNLSEFESLTKSPIFVKYGMTDKDGVFIKGAINNVCFTKELKNAIYEEWRAQILKIQKTGISISHIDGHHHCHAQPELYNVLKRLANNFGIKGIRQNRVYSAFFMKRKLYVGNNGMKSDDYQNNPNNPSFWRKINNAIKIRIWHYRTKFDFTTTDIFLSYDSFIRKFDAIRNKKHIKVELMCHPGHPKYEGESELLLNNAQNQKPLYDLISYFELKTKSQTSS